MRGSSSFKVRGAVDIDTSSPLKLWWGVLQCRMLPLIRSTSSSSYNALGFVTWLSPGRSFC